MVHGASEIDHPAVILDVHVIAVPAPGTEALHPADPLQISFDSALMPYFNLPVALTAHSGKSLMRPDHHTGQGNIIDLSAIASNTLSGNDAFTFKGYADFSRTGIGQSGGDRFHPLGAFFLTL